MLIKQYNFIDAEGGDEVLSSIQLLIAPDSNDPLFLQIKSQLTYLILSGKLPNGTKLPTVRDLAKKLELNPGTVSRAYQELKAEGHIVSQQGRGTFVQTFTADTQLPEKRMDLLHDTLKSAVAQCLALGFSADDIHQAVRDLTVQTKPKRITFVAPTPQLARKYQVQLEQGCAGLPVHIQSMTLQDVSSENAMERLNQSDYLITLASLRYHLLSVLPDQTSANPVIALKTHVSSVTLEQLRALPASQHACLITEPRSLHGALNLLVNETLLSPDLPVALLDEPEKIRTLTSVSDVVIHSYSAGEILDQLKVPADKRLLLQFEVDKDSLMLLNQTLGGSKFGGTT